MYDIHLSHALYRAADCGSNLGPLGNRCFGVAAAFMCGTNGDFGDGVNNVMMLVPDSGTMLMHEAGHYFNLSRRSGHGRKYLAAC